MVQFLLYGVHIRQDSPIENNRLGRVVLMVADAANFIKTSLTCFTVDCCHLWTSDFEGFDKGRKKVSGS